MIERNLFDKYRSLNLIKEEDIKQPLKIPPNNKFAEMMNCINDKKFTSFNTSNTVNNFSNNFNLSKNAINKDKFEIPIKNESNNIDNKIKPIQNPDSRNISLNENNIKDISSSIYQEKVVKEKTNIIQKETVISPIKPISSNILIKKQIEIQNMNQLYNINKLNNKILEYKPQEEDVEDDDTDSEKDVSLLKKESSKSNQDSFKEFDEKKKRSFNEVESNNFDECLYCFSNTDLNKKTSPQKKLVNTDFNLFSNSSEKENIENIDIKDTKIKMIENEVLASEKFEHKEDKKKSSIQSFSYNNNLYVSNRNSKEDSYLKNLHYDINKDPNYSKDRSSQESTKQIDNSKMASINIGNSNDTAHIENNIKTEGFDFISKEMHSLFKDKNEDPNNFSVLSNLNQELNKIKQDIQDNKQNEELDSYQLLYQLNEEYLMSENQPNYNKDQFNYNVINNKEQKIDSNQNRYFEFLKFQQQNHNLIFNNQYQYDHLTNKDNKANDEKSSQINLKGFSESFHNFNNTKDINLSGIYLQQPLQNNPQFNMNNIYNLSQIHNSNTPYSNTNFNNIHYNQSNQKTHSNFNTNQFEDSNNGVNIFNISNQFNNISYLGNVNYNNRISNNYQTPIDIQSSIMQFFEQEINRFPNNYIIPSSDIKIGKQIGIGGTSEVYKGIYRGLEVAVKKLRIMDVKDEKIKEFKREVSSLTLIKSSHLILFMGAIAENDNIAIITEYCKGGNLFKLLENHSIILPWELRVKILYQIAVGMNFLHTNKPPIIHRDLKSLNILLTNKIEKITDTTDIKISDFGLSKIIQKIDSGSFCQMTGQLGTCVRFFFSTGWHLK